MPVSVSKVDYCNSVLAGVSRQLQDRLQSVLNVAARLVFLAPGATLVKSSRADQLSAVTGSTSEATAVWRYINMNIIIIIIIIIINQYIDDDNNNNNSVRSHP